MADASTASTESQESRSTSAPNPEREEEAIPVVSLSPISDDGATAPDESMLVSRVFIPEPTPRSQQTTRVRGVAVYPFGLSLSHLRRAAIVASVVVAVVWFLLQVQSILAPFIIAFFLAALLEPTIHAAEERGRSRLRTIITIYLLALLALSLVLVLIVPRAATQLQDITQNFSQYYRRAQKTADDTLRKPQNRKLLNQLGIKQEKITDIFNERSGPIGGAVNNFLGGLSGFFQELASKALWLVIIPIAGFFLMLDYPLMRAWLITLFPSQNQDEADRVSRQIVEVFSSYLRGLAKVCAIFGLTVCVWLWLMGVDYALAIGMLAGLLYAVPYVGQFGTAILLGAVTYSTGPHKILFLITAPPNSIAYSVFIVLSVVMLNNIYDQVITPRIVGGAVGLHPVVSLFAVTAGATVFGIPGMLLAMPVAGCIRVILLELFPRLKQPPVLLPAKPD